MVAAFFIAAALFVPDVAQAKDIYRWTDERGDTHYADKVPNKYKNVARRLAIDVGAPRISGERANVANAANAGSAPVVSRYPVSAGETAVLQPGNAVSSGASGSTGASGSSGTQDGTADCEALRRQYWASQACFNQFRNANGSVKPEAFSYCSEVQSPVAQCGPLITQP
jgi:hypothetical protein